MTTESKTPEQQMTEARITYYRCVAGSHTLFWICVALYTVGSVVNWIIT